MLRTYVGAWLIGSHPYPPPRKQLLDEHDVEDHKYDWFRFLFQSYKPSCYWYEIWTFFYRTILTGAVVLFEVGPNTVKS